MRTSLFRRTIDAIALLGAAARVAGATEAHRKPAGRDLDRLGIARTVFDDVRL